MRACKKCKHVIPDEALYCMYCGRSLQPDKAGEKKQKRRRRRPNGSGKIVKLKGERVRPYAASLPRSYGGGFIGTYETEAEAAAAIAAAIVARPSSDRADWTIQKFYDYYTGSDKYKKLAVKTQKAYASAWKHINTLAPRKMKDIKVSDWQECITVLINAGKSESSARNVKDLISALCREAMKDDIINKNHAQLLDLGGKKTEKKNVFTYDEINLLKKHDDDRRVKFILILVYTGMRVNELLDTRLEDVHEHYIISGNKTEAGKRRIIPILPDIQPYIEYFKGGNPEYLMHRDGAKLTDNYTRDHWFYPALVDLGILTAEETAKGGHPRITQHYARHTFATLAAEAKLEKNIISRIIGHTDFSTTDEYYVEMRAEHIYNEALTISSFVDSELKKAEEKAIQSEPKERNKQQTSNTDAI